MGNIYYATVTACSFVYANQAAAMELTRGDGINHISKLGRPRPLPLTGLCLVYLPYGMSITDEPASIRCTSSVVRSFSPFFHRSRPPPLSSQNCKFFSVPTRRPLFSLSSFRTATHTKRTPKVPLLPPLATLRYVRSITRVSKQCCGQPSRSTAASKLPSKQPGHTYIASLVSSLRGTLCSLGTGPSLLPPPSIGHQHDGKS